MVVVEALPGSKIDGCAMRLHDGSVVVGLSGRGRRLDGFVFTLLHELAHVILGHIDDHTVLDEEVGADDPGGIESAANTLARSWVFPDGRSLRPGPITRDVVLDAARRHDVHPSFVVGRLQWEQRLPWNRLRALIPSLNELRFDDSTGALVTPT